MTMKTPFEENLEAGLRAIDLELPKIEEKGGALIDYYFPILYANAPESFQFFTLTSRKIKSERALIQHFTAFQSPLMSGLRPPVEEVMNQGKLYEVCSVWHIKPGEVAMFARPHFELTALVNKWHIESIGEKNEKLPYDPGKMTLRTLNAVRGRLNLPSRGVYPIIETDIGF